MAQIFRLSRKCHQFCLFNCHNLTSKCLFNVPQYPIQLAKCVHTQKKNATNLSNDKFKDDREHSREIIDLKAPYKPPELSAEMDIVNKEHDPDTFGTLSKNVRTLVELNEMPEEEDDEVSTEFINEKGNVREHNMEYAKRIAKLIENNKIVDALNVLEVEMVQVGARPANYIYTLLIGACGRVGNTEKAFKLFSQMRKRGLKATCATYTGLLNACATCRSSNQGLKRVTFLREKMNAVGYEMNEANYNALIKVYGRHGRLPAAFTIVDEMLEKKVKPSLTTFNFLLQACISDSEAGFRHALMTWHKMRSRRVLPDEFSYNLLLRACRECGLGDEDATRLVIDALISPENQPVLELEQKMRAEQNNIPSDHDTGDSEHSLISSSADRNEDSESEAPPPDPQTSLTSPPPSEPTSSHEMSLEEILSEELPHNLVCGSNEEANVVRDGRSPKENRPNLISREPHLGDIIAVGEIRTAQDRLVLLGGLRGVLEEMAQDLVAPSLKTFTLLLSCIPATEDAERQLLGELRAQGLDADTELCNMLIKKRCFRGDMVKARAVLDMFQESRLQPDLITYGCLALCCETDADARKFVEELQKSGFGLNKEMLTGMLNQACHRYDVHYAEKVLTLFVDHGIRPDARVMQRLAEFIKKGLKVVEAKDQRLPISQLGNHPGILEAPWWRGEFFRFLRYHRDWKKAVQVEEVRPYEEQFRTAPEIGRTRNEDGRTRNEDGRMRNEDGRMRNENGRSRNTRPWHEDARTWHENGRTRNEDGRTGNEDGRTGNEDGRTWHENGRTRNTRPWHEDARPRSERARTRNGRARTERQKIYE